MALKADYTEADKFTRLGKSNIHKLENKSKAIKEALKDENVKKQTMDFISTNFKNNDVMLQTVIWGLMKFGSKEASI